MDQELKFPQGEICLASVETLATHQSVVASPIRYLNTQPPARDECAPHQDVGWRAS